MTPLEQRTIAKVTARLVPFLIVCFFVAYLDRVNVSFAALTMNKDLGLSDSAFGFGAGIFFLAYFVFEVPSNLFLERVGARKWIARIMFTWGLCSGGMAFINGMVTSYPELPFGGIKQSGYGRELTDLGMHEFMNAKTVWVGAPGAEQAGGDTAGSASE